MHHVVIDNVVYKECSTLEEARQTAWSLQRWASTSMRIDVRPAEPVEVTPACATCSGTGQVAHLGFRRDGWLRIVEPCPACRPPTLPAAA